MVYASILQIAKPPNQKIVSIGWKWPALAGFLNFASYWLVLWVYQVTEHTSYVVAFRQFSIVIGAIGAFIIYKERGLEVNNLRSHFFLDSEDYLLALLGLFRLYFILC